MSSKMALSRFFRTTGAALISRTTAGTNLPHLRRLIASVVIAFSLAGVASAAGIKVVPSAEKVTPGDSFAADIVVEGIPSGGLGAVRFRLNVSAPGSAVAPVSDTSQGRSGDVSVSSPLLVDLSTGSRSGIGDFFWNAKGPHGILAIENDALQDGSGMFTLGHTSGASLPSGSGTVARFLIKPGKEAAAEKIVLSLSDVALLDGSTEYPVESNTGATVDLKCYTQAPDLIGLSAADAETALTNAKLSPGTVYELDNADGSRTLNAVLAQSVNAGTTVLCETTVDIAINVPPAEATNVQAVDKAGDETGTLVFSWIPSSSPDAAGYRVYSSSGTRLSDIPDAAATGTEVAGLADGQSQQFRITAYDTYGNESAGATVSGAALDDVAPRISISGVNDGAYYAVDVQPSISVQDANLASKQITLNGAAYDDLPIALDADYILKVTATDKSGNNSMKDVKFIVDKTPPAVIVSGIVKNTYYNTDLAPVISVTDTNLDRTENFLNGSAYVSGTVISEENDYQLLIQAVDKAGNSSTDTWPFHIDKTRPVSAIAAGTPKYENGGKVYAGGTTAFTLSATDEGPVVSGIDRMEYRTNGGLWTVYAGAFTLTGLADGAVNTDYRAVDKAANTEDFKTLSVTLDSTAPVTTLAAGEPKHVDPSGAVYVTQATSFSLSATDALSGVALTEYRVDSGNWTTAAPFTITAEGSHTVLYRSKDNLGNAEADKTFTAIVDNTAPVTTIATGDPKYTALDGKLYVTSDAVFTLAAADNLSGIAKTEYRLDNGQWTAYGAPFTVGGEGTHTIDYRSQDNVANIETSKTLAVIVDNTAPVTSIATGDPQYTAADGKLYVTPATAFTLAAADSLSGVGITEYRIDGGAWTTYAPFTIAGEGTHTVEFRSQDNVTNAETSKTLTLIVDHTAPVTNVTTGEPQYTDVEGKLYITSAALFTLSAADNLSGVAVTEYRIDGNAWTAYAPFTVPAEGTHTIEYYSKDNVTNAETYKTLTVIVDNTPPATTITTGDPEYTAPDGKLYVTSSTTFTLAAADNLSGVAVTEYRIDGNAWTAHAPFTVPAEGTHTIEYYSKDNVTNAETYKTLTVIVDNTPPATTITTGDPQYTAPDGKLYVTSSTTFTLAAADDLSGVAGTEYRIDNGAWTVYASFTISAEGTHAIDYRSRDNVTNEETFKTLTVIVDNTPPSSEIAVSTPQYGSDGKLYVSGRTGITITAADGSSGVKKTEYSIDGGAWTVYTAAFTLGSHADGSRTIYYRSLDNVNNAESPRELAVVLDKTPPQTTITASDRLIEGVLNTVSPSTFFTLSAVDTLSGVKSTAYRIDNGSWETYTGSFNLAGMKAGQYTVAYRATDNVLNEEDEKTLTVRLVTLQVEKKIAADPVVLVGVQSENSDLARKQTDTESLGALLSSLNVTYTIAENMDEFTTALRSGRYNTYVLIDVKEPLIGEEVREAVHYGDSLIFIKTSPNADPFLDDVFGVKFSGKTTNDNLVVDLLTSPISVEGTLQTTGKSVVCTPTTDKAQIFGSAADKHTIHPSIVFNQYERGKVLLYTFDLLSASDRALASALLVESLNFVTPAAETPRALSSLPIRITLTNSAEALEVQVRESFPSGATVDSISPRVTPVENTLTWQKSLVADEKAGFGYYLNLPDLAGDYLTRTELSYNNNGVFTSYGTHDLTLTVENSSGDLLQKIMAEVRALQVKSASDADLIAKALDQLLLVDVNAANRKEAEGNIGYILQAIGEVRKLSVEISAIRTELDELLKVWEKKWYLMEAER